MKAFLHFFCPEFCDKFWALFHEFFQVFLSSAKCLVGINLGFVAFLQSFYRSQYRFSCCVETLCKERIEALHPLESGVDIGSRKGVRMSDMCISVYVRNDIRRKEFLLLAWICLEELLCIPLLLPFLFYLAEI